MTAMLLRDLVTVLESGARPKGGVSESGDILSVGAEHLTDNGGFAFHNPKRISRAFFETMTGGKLRPQDILIVKDGATTGKVAFVGADFPATEAAVNEHVFRISIDTSQANPAFVFRFLQNPRGQVQLLRDFRGATVGGITRAFIDGVRLPAMSRVEQDQIAVLLDKADDVRLKIRKSLILLDALLSAAFLEMFGDPMRNEGRLDVVRLEDVADIVSGITKGRKISRGDTSSVPYIRVANVQDGYLALDDIKVIEATGPEVVRYCLERGDILLTEGGDADKLGRGAVWQGEIANCIHQNHVFRVRITDARLTPDYVSALLGSSYGKRYFLKAAKQTTGIASINRTQLGRFPTLVPPVEQQHLYSSLVRSIKRLEAQFGVAAKHAERLFTSISQKAFRDNQ